ncbi:hypothetical protein AVV36_gp033 [Pectobacterium bacteriophage PM2]|uniref:Uncharacterized protein n=1 Tax=Pectobacterium bacteriophage PM2 TaxID=1429794 RepID=A0A0A0Q2D0_9CAUD|nr:hypothetical protein AVV36_gp033 [Pectobacterium bacteriophage PM2]AHY24995.1 hypothetical protein PM2_033 [Pectobacterium bacteriophage PM2]
MNIYIMYLDRPHRPPYKSNMGWQVYIETPCSDSLPWGLVDVFNYSTKPTKRQIRKAKKAFYKNIKSEIESRKMMMALLERD